MPNARHIPTNSHPDTSLLFSPAMPALRLILVSALAVQLTTASYRGSLFLDGDVLPPGFIYGCGTSAYQIEGAWNVDGKSPSIWDTFVHDKHADHILYGATGDVANDFYHKYTEDLPLFKNVLGVTTYDFTIAWSRIMPAGRGPLNPMGVAFYRNVIRTSNAFGMSNICTLYHWDLPQSLQTEYGGWLNRKIVDDFRGYARAVFKELGNECSHWVTMNESTPAAAPKASAPSPTPLLASCRRSKSNTRACTTRSSRTPPPVDEFRLGGYKGKIGIKIDGGLSLPLDPSKQADRDAAARAMDFEVGRDVAPLYTGDYPASVLATGALPLKFTPAEKKLLNGSVDFLGLDFYTSQWVTATPHCTPQSDAYPECIDSYQQNPITGIDIGRPTASDWNFDAPNATIYGGIRYVSDTWGAKNIIISETGMGVLNETNFPLPQVLEDSARISWYRGVLLAMKQALEDGLPLVGFIPWSCIDNFEWSNGYNVRFGLINVEYNASGQGSQQRNPKLSGAYLKGVLTHGNPINPYNFGG
ncbi:glycoside hydrolase [Mycena rebaudengoi]|nr:glycoside hydrolase [Mycena rebaudengoi]